jgi:hypothetical protein
MQTKIIERIRKVITVEDLMTNAKLLKRVDNILDAKSLFSEYDVIPYPQKGKIKGFFHRDCESIKPIEIKNLISNGTDIFELLKLLDKYQFYFVLSANEIIGYVHYSDLNKHSTKIPLFVLFENTERILWQQFEHRIKEKDLFRIFKEKEVKKFLKKREKNISENVDIGWAGIFTFPSMLRLAGFYGLVNFDDKKIRILKETRNKIAHSDRNLVTSHGEVKHLLIAINTCSQIINIEKDINK